MIDHACVAVWKDLRPSPLPFQDRIRSGGRDADRDKDIRAGSRDSQRDGQPDCQNDEKQGDIGLAEPEIGTDIRERLRQPPKYAVLLHNDDYTTMEFVVEVLRTFFKKTEAEAMQIMLRIHHEGQGVAGIYSCEIAETKVAQVHALAQSRGYPLRCSIEPSEP